MSLFQTSVKKICLNDFVSLIIGNTIKKIDQMAYELYGLTEEEIKIVEQSTN